jgi:hypothetical protein
LGVADFFHHGESGALVSVEADKPGRAYALSKEAYERIKNENMALAINFQDHLLGSLSDRSAANLAIQEMLLKAEY